MSDITQHYGGSILAMKGKSSVAIISDNRLGQSSITTSKTFQRIFELNPKCYVGFTAFVPDFLVFFKQVRKNYNLFCLNERREMTPREAANMISYMLYSKRNSYYYIDTTVVGIQDNEPYVCSMDCLGAKNETNFVASGTATDNLLGLSESLYEEKMDDDELLVAIVQTFLNAIDRNALSGWGAQVYIINEKGVIKRGIKGRQD